MTIDGLELPDPVMRNWIGSKSDSDFLAWGGYFFRRLLLSFGLKRGSRVLEGGCGPGSLARWLAPFLRDGTYDGFDVNVEAIAFDSRTIEASYPKARFHFANVGNPAYAPSLPGTVEDYRFPAEDASIDLVVGISLWTHLLAVEARAYLREVRRVLAPGGSGMITLLLAREGEGPIPGPDGTPLPRRESGEYAASHWLVAYPLSVFSALARDVGLEAELVEFGNWREVVAARENPDSWIQDVVRVRARG
jgi:SAM-dependent methyltransferase